MFWGKKANQANTTLPTPIEMSSEGLFSQVLSRWELNLFVLKMQNEL